MGGMGGLWEAVLRIWLGQIVILWEGWETWEGFLARAQKIPRNKNVILLGSFIILL